MRVNCAALRLGAGAVLAAGLACSAPAAITPTPGITEIFPLPDTAVPATPTPAATSAPAGPSLTLDQLKNAAYPISGFLPSGSAALVNGHYAEQNAQLQGETDVDLTEPVAFGDINGDGAPDALVRLIVQTTGTTGHFSLLFPVINQNGAPQVAASVYLGDRIKLNSLAVDAGLITADMIVSGPNDGACCPNTPAIRTFRFESAQLVEYVNGATATPYIAPLDYETFKSMNYHDIPQAGDTFGLFNGSFTGAVASGQAAITLTDTYVPGDLDGNGTPDALIVLTANTGGTGTFYYLVAMRNDNGVPAQAATTYLGDRVIIDSIEITSGLITVNMKIAGPNDGACCPNTPAVQKYKLEGAQFTQVN